MKNRPLLFIIIALAHILEPIVKIIYFKATTPFTLPTILSNIAQIQTPREFFEFWLLFPLAGLALMGVKKWSYPVFVGAQVYSIYSHMTYEKYTWPYVSEVPFISSLVLLAVNIIIIVYFLLPDVRKPFYDKSVRWWETRTRYSLKLPITFSVNDPNKLLDCDILNMSQTGVFLNHKGVFEVDTVLKMNINFKGHSITLNGVVKSHHSFQGERGLGVKFAFENIWEKLAIKSIIREMRKEIRLAHKRKKEHHELGSAA